MKKVFVLFFVCIMILGLTTIAQSAPYPETQKNLMAAVTGETQANANYLAFADVADKEGHNGLAAIFRAIAAAELKHANDEFEILKGLDNSVVKPTPTKAITGTTKENLKAAIEGETEEYTIMYPAFIAVAQEEGMAAALRIFRFAARAEEVHAGIFTDLLNNFDNFDKVKYAHVYRCETCGNIILTNPSNCPICGVRAENLIEYEIVKDEDRWGCNSGFVIAALGVLPFVVRRRK